VTAYNEPADKQDATLAAVDVSQVTALNQAIDALADEAISKATTSDWSHIQAARNVAQHFSYSSDYRDLRQFMTAIHGDTSITQSIRTRANAVVTQLGNTVVANQTETSYQNCGGLSIYLPYSGSGMDSDYKATQLVFADSSRTAGTSWRDFLLKLPGGKGTSLSKYADDWGQDVRTARALDTAAGVRTVVDSVIDTADDVDFYQLTASAGQLLFVRVHGDGVQGDTMGLIPAVTVYGPDQETVLAHTAGGIDPIAVLPVPVPVPALDTYYLAVTSHGNDDPLNPSSGETAGRYTIDLIYGNPEEVNPGLVVSQDAVDFGAVEVGSVGEATLVLTNPGGTRLDITALQLADDSAFRVSDRLAMPRYLTPGESVSLFVRVRPDQEGPLNDTLRIRSTDPMRPAQEVVLTALGVDHLLGDLNLDGTVNGLDVQPFVDVVINGPYNAAADMNQDGAVNGLDVNPFVTAVVGADGQAGITLGAVTISSTTEQFSMRLLRARQGHDSDDHSRLIHHRRVEQVFARRARFGRAGHRSPQKDMIHQVADDWQATVDRAFGDGADWIG
jgi:hypothetical protein